MDILIQSKLPELNSIFRMNYFLEWTRLLLIYFIEPQHKYFINYNKMEYIYYICYSNLKIYYTSLNLRTDYLLMPF